MPAQSDARRNTHLDVAPRLIAFKIGILGQLVPSGEVWSSAPRRVPHATPTHA